MLRLFLFVSALVAFDRSVCVGGIVLTNADNTYGQDFDTLASDGASSVLPTAWALLEAGTNADTIYVAGTGSSNAGNTYSFGATGSSERALGTLLSGTLSSRIGVSFSNGGSTSIESFSIAYRGEQWRLGAEGRIDQLDFQYSVNATSLATGTWLDVDALDFIGPLTSGGTGAKDGNAAANFQAISGQLAAAVAPGDTLWMRWVDFNATGADDGLAIDSFSASANFSAVPEPSSFALSLAAGLLGLCRWRAVCKNT